MNSTNKVALALIAITLTACSDSTVAPREQPVEASSAVNVAGGGSSQSLSPMDTLRFSITIQPYTPTIYQLGLGNSIVFPAASVCDPATSNYGPAYWDTPCTAAKVPVTVNVKAWLDANGHVGTDFSPNIRFVPSALPTGWVSLAFSDYAASQNPMFKILYCATPGSASSCADESATDPSLTTYRNPITGQVSRRIKHFSGYMVGAGRDDGSGDGSSPSMSRTTSLGGNATGQPTAAGTTPARGGYILVSGRKR